ncbi:MAG: glycosyltransferase family 4 protein [Bacteroidetes bacterium]|nr:glycosyltransferase family 4 protein [Bacteroidota bacterium]
MKNVLIVVYNFPPLGGSATVRTVKFVKYLNQFGWNPIILTVGKDFNDIEYSDTSFLETLDENIRIYRARVIEPHDIYRFLGGRKKQGSRDSKLLHLDTEGSSFLKKLKQIIFSSFIPDTKIGWFPGAIRLMGEIFKKHNIDVIYSASPKNTAHLIAKFISKKQKKPWVADFHDPWPAYYITRPWLFKKLDETLEKKVLLGATKIVVAWPGIHKDITQRYPGVNENKIELIHMGFDEEQFEETDSKRSEIFTIAHAGVFYKDRTPQPLFKGLKLLFEEQPELRSKIRILFIGISDPLLVGLIAQYEISDVVELISFIPHKECVRCLLGSDMLFLNTLDDCIPGKLFEYLGCRKTILALVKESTTVAKIVRDTQSGIVVDPDNPAMVKDAILKEYEKYQQGELRKSSEYEAATLSYSYKKLTGRLSGILDDVVSE